MTPFYAPESNVMHGGASIKINEHNIAFLQKVENMQAEGKMMDRTFAFRFVFIFDGMQENWNRSMLITAKLSLDASGKLARTRENDMEVNGFLEKMELLGFTRCERDAKGRLTKLTGIGISPQGKIIHHDSNRETPTQLVTNFPQLVEAASKDKIYSLFIVKDKNDKYDEIAAFIDHSIHNGESQDDQRLSDIYMARIDWALERDRKRKAENQPQAQGNTHQANDPIYVPGLN